MAHRVPFAAQGLEENRRKIAGGMEDSDDLERFLFRIVHDQVVRVRLDNPEPNGQGSQVFSHSSRKRRVGKKVTSAKDCFLDTIGGWGIVLGYETPNVKEIGYGLRSELIFAHPRRVLSDLACFRFLSFECAASGSISSPRCAAA